MLFAPPLTTIPVAGSDQRFAVRRIYCVGRNYAAHAREMGSDPTREPPFFFLKPRDAVQVAHGGRDDRSSLSADDEELPLRSGTRRGAGQGGRDVPVERALDLVYGYAVGLDMTRRDLQRMMGDQKKPWELGKAVDNSAVITPLHRADETGHFASGAIWLKLNGETKQSSDLGQMIWNVAEQIANLSQYYELDRRRPHLLRDAGKRRPRGEGRPRRGARRRSAGPQDPNRLKNVEGTRQKAEGKKRSVLASHDVDRVDERL